MPRISVIIPVFNGEGTIRQTIESVLNQTFFDFELILINDGSTDSTLEIISGFKDSRLKVFSHQNSGVAESRNRGVLQATGKYIAFLGKVPGGIGSVSPKLAKDQAVDIKHLRVSVNSEWIYLFQHHGFECTSITGYYYPGLLREPLHTIDKILTRFPFLANSNLFLLRKPIDVGSAFT